MPRTTLFNSPFLIGFDQLEHLLDSAAKNAAEGYPPYNIEHTGEETLRISLAVAGFTKDDIQITLEASQLIIRGKITDTDNQKEFLHRGIAARQFIRKFVLADGMDVTKAGLENGLLHIDLVQPKPEPTVRSIPIG